MPSFRRIDVTEWTFLRTETIGQSEAEWLCDPAFDVPGESPPEWLFKPVETHKNGTRQGGDWAEKIVSELATLLGIPSASIELAALRGREGSISRDVAPPLFDLFSGRLWVGAAVNDYPRSHDRVGSFSEGYTLSNIQASLSAVGPPPDFQPTQELSGFEVFCGYLLLDALVANRDRHEENWGVMKPTVASGTAMLAPLFDNAGSVGYQLSDLNRTSILEEVGGLDKWAAKGTAWRFDETGGDGKMLTLVELALAGLASSSQAAQRHWRSRFDALTKDDVQGIIEQIPGMSVVSRTFAIELIMTNAGRIRDGYRSIAA